MRASPIKMPSRRYCGDWLDELEELELLSLLLPDPVVLLLDEPDWLVALLPELFDCGLVAWPVLFVSVEPLCELLLLSEMPGAAEPCAPWFRPLCVELLLVASELLELLVLLLEGCCVARVLLDGEVPCDPLMVPEPETLLEPESDPLGAPCEVVESVEVLLG